MVRPDPADGPRAGGSTLFTVPSTVASDLVAVLFATHAALPRPRGRARVIRNDRPGSRRSCSAPSQPDVVDALVPLEPRAATRERARAGPPGGLPRRHRAVLPERRRPHRRRHRGRVRRRGMRRRLAAGAGLAAVEALDRGEADAAFCAVRPPGHHATAERAMGFCLLNNVAVTAAAPGRPGRAGASSSTTTPTTATARRTIFYADPRVLYVSFHEYPLYPGTGGARARPATATASGSTLNFPVPEGTTGDVYLAALDDVVGPGRRALRPDLDAHVGRLRRPPPRPDHRSRA